MLLSTPLLLEYEAVCQREEHRLAAGLTRENLESFLDGVVALAEPVTVHFLWRPQLRDAADEMVLEAAVEKLAKRDGTSVNQFVVVAVAEKLSAMATADQLADRRTRADLDTFDRIMNRAGGEPPRPDDML